jgi:hypothetical protein
MTRPLLLLLLCQGGARVRAGGDQGVPGQPGQVRGGAAAGAGEEDGAAEGGRQAHGGKIV